MLMLFGLGGIAWWMFGFPGASWAVTPMMAGMPVTFGMLIVLGLTMVGLWAGFTWFRENL